MEKFQPKFEAPKDKGTSQEELGGIKKRTIEALDNVTNEEVQQVLKENTTIKETGWNSFASMAWDTLKKGELEQHPELIEALQKYPLVDLASGPFSYSGELLEALSRKGIKIPKYIGVDKHNIPSTEVEERYEVNFLRGMLEKSRIEGIEIELKGTDMLLFLRSLKPESVNIQIAGFDYDVSRPQSCEDKYRALLIKEIARVVAKDGVVLSIANDGLSGRYEGVDISLKYFGFKYSALNTEGIIINSQIDVYRRSSDEESSWADFISQG